MSLVSHFSESIEFWIRLAGRVPREQRLTALQIVKGLIELADKVDAVEHRFGSAGATISAPVLHNRPESVRTISRVRTVLSCRGVKISNGRQTSVIATEGNNPATVADLDKIGPV